MDESRATIGRGAIPRARGAVVTALTGALVAVVLGSGPAAARQGSVPEAKPELHWRELDPPDPPGETLFELLPPERTGIHLRNDFDWDHERKYLYVHGYACGGVCLGDYDGDGLPDVYVTSQTGRDRLYRNRGEVRFEDASDGAGISERAEWGTGASFADVDGDGHLDLYVCNYDAPNALYHNRADGTFAEEGRERGLARRGASVMAGFADYDLDGDLDVYLVTYRLYTPEGRLPKTVRKDGAVALAPGEEELFAIQERRIDGEVQKFIVQAGQRDLLLENDGGLFRDVSDEAGISGNQPGLSATWWDPDRDGFPDLYVCNDFWDPDRFYRNDGDGTFSDVLTEAVPHTPWFSMGADFGDLDNDGRIDFVAADMSATTHFMSKIMMGEMNESRWFLESAEPRQYMRNAVYWNTGTPRFMEIAYLAGLASTDWTWSVKLGDYDNDGWLDLFATNGTANHSFDGDLNQRLRDLRRDQDRRGVRDPERRSEEYWALYRSVPPRREANRALRNTGELRFEDASAAWGLDHVGISFGAARGDLDRDGDLDLVVNNVGDPVSVYRNTSSAPGRLLVSLRGAAGPGPSASSNTFGLGATLTVEAGDLRQTRQLALARGYMSADDPVAHFGLAGAERVERLTVAWPNGRTQTFENLSVGRHYTVHEPGPGPEPEPAGAEPAARTGPPQARAWFEDAAGEWGLEHRSVERPFDDYAAQPLLPARLSQSGPGLACGDVDGDGDDDLFVGGPAGQAGALFWNGGGAFRRAEDGPWDDHAECEDMAPLFFDADADGHLDLFVASGGVECAPGSELLADRLYRNAGAGQGAGAFAPAPPGALPDLRASSSAACAADFDRDGDLDLFVGGRSVPGRYPEVAASRLLRNDLHTGLHDGGAHFEDVTDTLAPGLRHVGRVTAALWSDADGDGAADLLVACEWGPVSFWQGGGGALEDRTREAGLAERRGWWSGLVATDLDADGDLDYAALNAGLNTKYHASPSKPQHLYWGDFDGDGTPSLVEAKPGRDELLPVRGLSCSSAAMPFIREKLPTFRAFAAATLPEIYSSESLEAAGHLEAVHLESGVLWNEAGPEGGARFRYEPLPRPAQASPGYGAASADFDADGHVDLYFAQNFFGREPETGRWDGGLSAFLRGRGAGRLEWVTARESGLVVCGDATGVSVLDADGDAAPDLVVAQNEGSLRCFRNAVSERTGERGRGLAVRLRGGPGNPTCVGARVTLHHPDGRRQAAEVHAGAGYLSQGSAELFFGRGRTAGEHTLTVRWPSGHLTRHAVDSQATRVELDAPR